MLPSIRRRSGSGKPSGEGSGPEESGSLRRPGRSSSEGAGSLRRPGRTSSEGAGSLRRPGRSSSEGADSLRRPGRFSLERAGGFLRNRRRELAADFLIGAGVFLAVTGIGALFDYLGFAESNIIIVYILGTVVISALADSLVPGFFYSILGVVVFNYLFTEPRYTLFVYEPGYPATFAVMFLVAVITGTLAGRLKQTAARQAEAELKAREEAMRANLLRSISHDLRTPLTAISGHASNLLTNEDRISPATRKMLYQDIYDDSAWLIDLVENLLSVSRISDGRMNVQMETESLEDILQEALRHINRKAREHDIRLSVSDDMILVRVDSRLLMQVIINLVNNAISYTPENSRIGIFAWTEGDLARIRVEDNGPGIPDDEKEKVFEMFYSGNNDRGDRVRSTGIGLAVCRSIITAHGGSIYVEDASPSGASFVMDLPLVRVEVEDEN